MILNPLFKLTKTLTDNSDATATEYSTIQLALPERKRVSMTHKTV